jgi:LAGLIDADG endonuclease
MASSHPSLSFASDRDRDAFGHWLAGFCDGEGCFILSWRRSPRSVTGIAKFVIAPRDDDRPILEEIRAFLGCGTVHARFHHAGKPQSRISVPRVDDLANVVIPTFERFHLRAKKSRDFHIWCRGVRLI